MLFAIEDEIRDFCEENVLEFESEGEFNLYIAELNLLEEKAEERGEDFDWQNGALRYYRVFRGRRDEMNAAGEQKHAVSLSAFNEQELPTLPDELIGGILRKRRKMLLVGPSKAGKTGLLMELALALASGGQWLGFPCRMSRVLYIDLENDETTSVNRFFRINQQRTGSARIPDGLALLSLKGEAAPLDKMKERIIREAKGYDVVILDPMYKMITGDENSATDMAYFCRQLDDIVNQTDTTVIYCHHHSKGAQGQKRAMDRASGSGVFARDADALLDIIELNVTDKYRASHETPEGGSAWRMEFTLREFAPHGPVSFWYDYPVHRLDEGLSGLYVLGSREANLALSRKRLSREEKEARARQVLDDIFAALDPRGQCIVGLDKAAKHANLSTRTLKNYSRLLPDEYDSPARTNVIIRKKKADAAPMAAPKAAS